jgi:hypothetical protein
MAVSTYCRYEACVDYPVDFKTPGIPRTVDGKPDLTAPAPRTADGHSERSRLWQRHATLEERNCSSAT